MDVKLDTQIHLHQKILIKAPRLISKFGKILHLNEYIHRMGYVIHDYGWVGVVDDIDNVVAGLLTLTNGSRRGSLPVPLLGGLFVLGPCG